VSERALIYKTDWNAAELFAEYGIPEHLQAGLERYLKHGIRPGGFLQAVLKNDLVDAKQRAADALTFLAAYDILTFLACEASGHVWGSPQNVERWLMESSARRRGGDPVEEPVPPPDLALESCDLGCGDEFEAGAARCRHGRDAHRAIRSAVSACIHEQRTSGDRT
jgi:hypothetical protein